jgi:hypothetical protein
MKSKCETSKRSKTRFVASVIVAILALIPSCSSGNPGGDPPKSTSVYVAGDYGGQACYWKGTERTDLPDPGSGWSTSYGIDVSGGVVYTAGFYNDGVINACYWEGTTRRDLPGDGANSSYAYSIQVSGGIVYVAGYYSDGETNLPCLWEGTTRIDLPKAAYDSQATGIDVLDGIAHASGWYTVYDATIDGLKMIPCYWTVTDGTPTKTDLPGGSDGGRANGIIVVME